MFETSLLVTLSADYSKPSEFKFANDQDILKDGRNV